MKLKNYFLSMLILGAMSACNSDEIVPEQPRVVEPDAFLSLTAQSNVMTKAGFPIDENTVADQKIISDLTVAIFDDGAYEIGIPYESNSNRLVAIKTVDIADADAWKEVTKIAVKSGKLKVLALANMKGKVTLPGTALDVNGIPTPTSPTLADFLNSLQTDLTKETTNFISMSSAVLDLYVLPGYNFLGYDPADWQTNNPGLTGTNLTPTVPTKEVLKNTEQKVLGIQIYRNVANVQLAELAVVQKSEWGSVKSFSLDSVFMMNVKGKSQLASVEGWGTVEAPEGKYNWYDGSALLNIGVNKPIKTHVNGSILGTLGHKGGLYENGVEKVWETTFNYGSNETKRCSPNFFFYVYENGQPNRANEGDYTALVIKATIEYIPDGFTPTSGVTTKKTGYYPVIIGKDNITYVSDDVKGLTYVKRNVKYIIKATIKGPGYDNPADPEAAACLAAKVYVAKWNVVKIEEGNLQ